MMGAGKSSVGKALAAAANRQFLDTDQLLQQRFGRPVSQIFRIYGEDTFRAHETSVLKALEPDSVVLATGGGIVLREVNWTEMQRLGITVYLHVREELLLDRLANSKKKRPLLEVDDWQGRVEELLQARRPLYERADVKVDVGDLDIEDTALRIVSAIEAWERNQ
jgi:shikimate kinase